MIDIAQNFWRKFTEAWIPCMACMVQGNLAALTWYHAGIAAKVGILTGIAFVITTLIRQSNNKWLNAALTGILTMLADWTIHPTHFSEWWAEGAITGMGAALLAVIVSTYIWKKEK